MEILYIIIGLFAGALIIFLLKNQLFGLESFKDKIEKLEGSNSQQQNLILELEKKNSTHQERLNNAIEHFSTQKDRIELLEKQNVDIQNTKVQFESENHFLKEKLEQQKEELQEMKKQLTLEFQNIANKILDEKSEKFTIQNKNQLDVILNPFKEKILSFEKTINDTYLKNVKERSDLANELKNLTNLNQQMREDAQNLTNALKQDNKLQGNWGELILEKILERSGLQKDIEYKIQHSIQNIEGKRIQPDVVIFLPDNKHLIIDSKVSLVAYEQYVNAEDETQRESNLKNHLLSIKNHIKNLAEKDYSLNNSLHSPDFVLLFMPIESAFGLSVKSDNELFNYAWDRKIVIVSPSTLLATLKTISSIWQQEKQNRNALKIAQQAGALYDKFVGFTESMQSMGKQIMGTQKAYEDTMRKLSEGTGNIVKRVQDLKKLGIQSKKDIPPHLLDSSAKEEI